MLLDPTSFSWLFSVHCTRTGHTPLFSLYNGMTGVHFDAIENVTVLGGVFVTCNYL